MPEFSVHVWEGSIQRVCVAGEIDLATAPQVAEVLTRVAGDITVDCTEVTFIDSAGTTLSTSLTSPPRPVGQPSK